MLENVDVCYIDAYVGRRIRIPRMSQAAVCQCIGMPGDPAIHVSGLRVSQFDLSTIVYDGTDLCIQRMHPPVKRLYAERGTRVKLRVLRLPVS